MMRTWLRLFISTFLVLGFAAAGDAPSVDVTGALPRTGALRRSDLEALGPVTSTWEEHGKKHEVTGVPLDKVLAAFGFSAGPRGKTVPIEQKRAGWRKVLVAVASDGYQAAFSCAELSPEVGNTRALLAWKMDGAELREDSGPFRLVVLSDREPARSVRQLVRLVVVDVTREERK